MTAGVLSHPVDPVVWKRLLLVSCPILPLQVFIRHFCVKDSICVLSVEKTVQIASFRFMTVQ